MATHHSSYDPENSPNHYTFLPGQPESTGSTRRKSLKVVSIILLSSLLLLSLLTAFVMVNKQSPELQNNSPETLIPSRGVSQGVSEKTFRDVSTTLSYAWSNAMLTWQRTAYHFQPQQNWMNGPLYHKGWYHIFYQYNPDSAIWGNITWGHAVSTDLIHWLYLPFAMVPDQWYDINGVWTGSATILPDGQIMMLYTGDTDDYVQVQNLAYPANLSDPLLLDWVKYRGNPVMVPPPGIGIKDFRDPTTAWTGPQNGQWLLTIGSKMGKTGIALVYDTSNFTSFNLLHGVLHAVPGTGMWECVDFYPVSTLDSNGLDTSYNGPGIKHVLKASLDDNKQDHYAIGTYDLVKNKWTPDNPELDCGIGLRLDYGKYYASKTFYDPKKQRRVLWGWVGETDSESADLQKGWSSLQSIPRTVLYDKKTGTNLLQWPIEEIESLRAGDPIVKQLNLQPGSIELLHVNSAAQLDIEASFEVDKVALEGTIEANAGYNCGSSGGAASRGILGPFGVVVIADQTLSELTPVYFYISKGADGRAKTHFCADQTRSSEAPGVAKQVYGSSVPVLDGEKHSMRLLVDHSIVESFGQGGRTVITSRIYPAKAINGAARLFVFNNATGTSVTASLKIWSLKSADIQSFPLENL
ncbi:acid beta-fructofuranosidase AIV-18 isoform X2 [Lycium ferocissimum]|uniref:acid beta-fructofuranosidase AIV-18 isoform X2 n=1 Tax=Lycium ferocissimum TaxID=112874 RepID=UPI002814F499|nr:acid beta-fructofuranosidase AIV-18 isoform X2 [Lycium ferocissimum]